MSMLAPARAAASRRNGAQSRGPKTPQGKTRSAQNALKHGLRAQRFVVIGAESAAEFAALEAALADELAPEGTLQGLLAGRIARAAWRLERAERIEAELFAVHGAAQMGLAMIRDGNGSRAFGTLLRYRGAALAELSRALRLLKALQAEAQAHEAAPAAPPPPDHDAAPAGEQPIEPETRRNVASTRPAPAADHSESAPEDRAAAATSPFGQAPRGALPCEMTPARAPDPIEPEVRANPAKLVPVPAAERPPLRDGGLRLSRIPDRR